MIAVSVELELCRFHAGFGIDGWAPQIHDPACPICELFELRERARRWLRGCRVCGTMRSGVGADKRLCDGNVPLCSGCRNDILDYAFERIREHPANGRWPRSEMLVEPPLEDELDELVRRAQRAPDLYLARSRLGGELIKIGKSIDVPGRMKALRAEPIVVLPGKGHHEKRLHKRFADLRVEGEWFKPGPPLLAFIDRASTGRVF